MDSSWANLKDRRQWQPWEKLETGVNTPSAVSEEANRKEIAAMTTGTLPS